MTTLSDIIIPLYPKSYLCLLMGIKNKPFNGKFRDGLFNGENFTTLLKGQILIKIWRKEYNKFRAHSSLNYEPPTPNIIKPKMEILT
jgi:hypothetical protein